MCLLNALLVIMGWHFGMWITYWCAFCLIQLKTWFQWLATQYQYPNPWYHYWYPGMWIYKIIAYFRVLIESWLLVWRIAKSELETLDWIWVLWLCQVNMGSVVMSGQYGFCGYVRSIWVLWLCQVNMGSVVMSGHSIINRCSWMKTCHSFFPLCRYYLFIVRHFLR